ncbi:5-oxoprolinase subunit C family protein [Gellertiella hungarica]|uniref:Biotin-dependent carboxylase-like uncharacterized protein n=1 Tax=Gellertiella hungarica TaxID=1572859 RepID=A0A7W6J340_9HYPH|nr:biotin-dependent carboxyltransferase family protein [Gellertiella hungarica]MBB4063869.1 biotin-dependent carboxylase-like uncharacterized protein [Gellertiella hungarica]
MIEILTTGHGNSVQDRGRYGYLDAGVGRSGAMDRLALDIANLMAGNGADAAGIEISVFPFRLRFHADCQVAFAGADSPVTLAGRALPSLWSAPARARDELRIEPPTAGARVYLAFEGGLDVPLVLGSRSTDLKSGWGGHEGRGLHRGDRLNLLPVANRPDRNHLPAGFGLDVTALRGSMDHPGHLRVLPGAEWAAFGEAGQRLLCETPWQVGKKANRQGYRLLGPELQPESKRELFSHGIMPGTVQVPPNGQPIIQLAEANTCGGYAKIAHVVEADLWRLGQLKPGDPIRFRPISREEAIEALREESRAFSALRRAVRMITRNYAAFEGAGA